MTGRTDDAAAAGTARRPVRVLVADDQQLIRDGIASLLAIQPGIESGRHRPRRPRSGGQGDRPGAGWLARAGIAQFGAQAAGRLASALAGHQAPAPGHVSGTAPGALEPPLTAREVDVLRLAARGATNREIAAHLFLSEGTVKNHISRILTRLSLRDRTQAAVYARDRGLI